MSLANIYRRLAKAGGSPALVTQQRTVHRKDGSTHQQSYHVKPDDAAQHGMFDEAPSYPTRQPGQPKDTPLFEGAPSPKQAKPKDPAHDPENIARMAEGAKTRREREAKHRELDKPRQDERYEHITTRPQPEWQEVEGVTVKRIGDSPYIAVPASGRKNSRRFDVIDLRDRSDIHTQLTKDEVNRWLLAQAERDAEETTDEPLTKAQSLADLAHAQLETK